ncbi:MAG: 3-hydroxyacyl-CoA dehydrogenase NAD-binding domain-containing protein [Proteobacteria bacterium]|nr:3-hydroxyacyl-CoA dehydrogenase NAD-binding domain-containing protein [Pseudomonadota bacterium]
MSAGVNFEIRSGVALVCIDNPPVNALGAAIRQGILDAIDRADADAGIKAVVLCGRGRCFSGGADITEFGKPRKQPFLSELITRIESAKKPIIAAIHGTAVGGGCEISLGCHYRGGDRTAQYGLPEIKLGLLPGAGGTQRLPRLIGVEAALGVILSGDYVDATSALSQGFLDEIVDGDLVEGALAFAARIVAEGAAPRRTRDIEIDPADTKSIFADARAKTAKRWRGLIAPERCIDTVAASLTAPLADGLALERKNFDELVQSVQSKAQRHLFFAERQAHRVPGVAKETPTIPIRKAAVIGCGTMGRGIAINFANAGIPVTVLEQDKAALEKGLNATRETYAGSVKRGSLAAADMEARLALITGTTEYGALADADIVIEAVFEDMTVKKQVFAALDRVCKPGAILATNTSSLDIDEIATATKRPESVVGTHFFSPANVMRLMENVRGAKTSPEVLATVMQLSKTIGKVGVVVGVCDGFVGNRMLYAYRSQAEFLLEEGALPWQVDKVIYEFGFPMGPFAMGDLAGLDVGYMVRQHRRKTKPTNDRYSSLIADRIVERGRHGQKTGKGWYLYPDGGRTPVPDPEIEKLIQGISDEMGIRRRPIGDQEILERCMYTLINEGAKILGEGIAARPGDIDLVWVHGYGYPIGRGGPMFHADTIGVGTVFEAMKKLHEQHGEMLRPAPLLEELAKSGKSFQDLSS